MGIFSWLFKGRGNNAGMKTAQEVRGTITPYDQGVAYYRGIGVEQDYSKAFYYLKLADEMGVPEASCFLGEMYEYGNCVEKDVEKALALYRRSADLGCATAIAILGNFYFAGDYVPKDYQKALNLYEAASAAGSSLGHKKLAWMYLIGIGVQINEHNAFELYLKAAEQGDVEAQGMAAWCYVKGRGIAQNTTIAQRWAEKAIAQGSSLGMYVMYLAERHRNTTKAKQWIEKAADAGDLNALRDIAENYEKGYGGFPLDINKAQEYWRKAAALGSEDAQWALKYPDPWVRESWRRRDKLLKAGINPDAALRNSVSETVTTDIFGNTLAYSSSDGSGTTVHRDVMGNTIGYSEQR